MDPRERRIGAREWDGLLAGRALGGSGRSSLFFDPITEEQNNEAEGSDKVHGSDCSRGLSGGSASGLFILHEHHQN